MRDYPFLKRAGYAALVAIIAAAAISAADAATRGSDPGMPDRVKQCRERCSSLRGVEKNNCFKSCLDENQRDSGDGIGDTGYAECEARCAFIEGERRVLCMRSCMAAKRKNAPSKDTRAKKKMAVCEQECAVLKGLDRIRCIRKCMEAK